MKLFGQIVAAFVAAIGFLASVLSIIDYALNKPEVVSALFGPIGTLYKTWIQLPIAGAIRELGFGNSPEPLTQFAPETVVASLLVASATAIWIGYTLWVHPDPAVRLQWRVGIFSAVFSLLVSSLFSAFA